VWVKETREKTLTRKSLIKGGRKQLYGCRLPSAIELKANKRHERKGLHSHEKKHDENSYVNVMRGGGKGNDDNRSEKTKHTGAAGTCI